MKNDFDLKGYMQDNKLGAYQQLNEMWYSDMQAIGQPMGMRHTAINEEEAVEEQEIEEGKKQLAFVIPCPDCYDIEEEAEHFQYLLDKAGVKAKVKANQVGEEAEVYTKDEKKARKVIEKNGYQIGWTEDNELEEMGGVKTIGDKGKMATPNSRPNLGRHRSSDMLDKMSKKDHDKNTVTGAKAAAYKAPHMKEDKFKSFGDPDLTLNDLNKDIVITPFELEKTWKDVYGEDFKTEYSGAYSYLTKNYKNFTIMDLVDVWERMYGEDFLYEYSGISKWLFSNQGKTSSKDKVAPKMNEDESEKEKAMYANTDPNIADPINQDDNVFSKSDDANWDGRKGGDYWNRDTNWENKIPGKEINGWVAGEESQAGSIFWQNPNYPNSLIYATPGWEGVDGIAIEVHDSEDGYLDEPKLQKVVGVGTDKWKTKEGYLDLMAKVFAVVEKMLTPSKEMAEDYMGTQYGSSDEMAVDMLKKGITREDEDPFGAIKTGIDQITQGDDGDMDMSDDDRFNQLGGDKIKAGIESLMGDGFDFREILQFVKDTIASKRNY